jgi:hypothetical protein
MSNDNKPNSFFSAFSGGNAGGGGGSVTSASNVGTGIGVFKAKVLQDLQFRTLLESKGINIAISIGGDEVEIGLETDVVGIGDGTGWYTYYSSITSALAVATAGQTITLFSNIVETGSVTIVLQDGVDIDLNGFSYTLNVADDTNMFDDDDGFVNMSFRNGSLIRLNSAQTTTSNGLALYIKNGSYISFTNNVYIQNKDKIVVRNSVNSQIIGGVWLGGDFATLGYSAFIQGTFTNSVFFITAPIYNNGSLVNSVIFNPSYGGVDNTGLITNCYIYSALKNFNSSGFIYGSTIEVFTDTALDCVGGRLEGCQLKGQTHPTAIMGSDAQAFNCSFYSADSNCADTTLSSFYNCTFNTNSDESVITAKIGNTFMNCSVINSWDDVNGHGFNLNVDSNTIIDCSIRVTNSSAFAIYASLSSTDAFLVNNKGLGCSALNNVNVVNSQTITPDLYGNILIG